MMIIISLVALMCVFLMSGIETLLPSAARLGNCDVAYTALQSRPRECQMYVTVLGPPQV